MMTYGEVVATAMMPFVFVVVGAFGLTILMLSPITRAIAEDKVTERKDS